jgi:cytochrome P450
LDELLDDDRTMLDTSFHGTKLANFVGALQQGAAETTSLAMQTNVLFLAKHPSVQEKAQKELDAVCGVERMPNFTDFAALPYINCIMKEGLRIRPV